MNQIKTFKTDVNVIKRGSKTIFLQYRNIAFVDALNFGPGCNLDNFGKMWGAMVKKGCFPYEMYKSIDEMQADNEWPAMLLFKSTLARNVYSYDIQTIDACYKELKNTINVSKQDFARKIAGDSYLFDQLNQAQFPVELPVYCKMWTTFELGKQQGSMLNMFDYLAYYNALDTEVLADAMSKYIEAFLKTFQINPNEHVTLPSIAEKVLWNYYDASEYHPYSFNQDFADVSNLIRSQLAGGLSCVFCRHVEIGNGEEKYQKSVHRASNGERFRQLISFDVNSKLFQLYIK